MGFFKKIFGDAADEIKKNLEDSRNDIRKNMEEMKRNAMADFSKRTTSSRDDDDDDDDDDAPRIILGKFSNGVLELRDDIEELDDESLEDYKNVKKIVFPRGLKKLDSDVICDQDKLEELDFSLVTELREIPDDFISGTTKIKEFIVPQGVKELGDGFVGECKPGTKIVIPSTVVKMGYLNGESNNDLVVYLFASRLKIEDAEEDIKTLYVLPEYYGYYAKQLKDCDSEVRLREIPEEMMNIYESAESVQVQSSQPISEHRQESKDSQKKKKTHKVRVSFNINGDEGFTRITMYPLIGKECQQALKNGVEHDRRTGALEVSQNSIDKLSELLTEKNEQLPLEFLFAHVCTPTELIVTDEESDEEIYNDEYEIDPRYGIMSMDEAVDNYEDDEEELEKYKKYLTDTVHIPDNNYISIGIAKTWDKLPDSFIQGEGFVSSVIGETLKVASEDDIALLHGETGLSDSTITFNMEIEDEFDPDKLDFINFDAEYGDVSSVLQETIAADFVSMNAIIYDGKMYFAQPQDMDFGDNEGDDYYDIVNHHLEGDQDIEFEPDPKQESKPESVTSVVPEPAPSAFSGLFSPRLEALINSALQDGVISDEEKAILKKRAEKEGEDWDEVEMIINSRLPRKEQASPKKTVELSDVKRAHLFLSFKPYEGDDYAFLFLIDDNQLYATDENLETPEIPSSDYFEDIDNYECWIENISDEYQSFKQLSESLVNDFVEARLDEFEGDTSALAIDHKYTVTVFVDKEKVYEEIITCR